MHILLLNAGSSSLKATLMDAASGTVVAHGQGDWAGARSRYSFAGSDGREKSEDVSWKGHAAAVKRFIEDLSPAQKSSLAAVGHRVVHGGSFTSPVRITPRVRDQIDKLRELAPLHNPPSLETLAA